MFLIRQSPPPYPYIPGQPHRTPWSTYLIPKTKQHACNRFWRFIFQCGGVIQHDKCGVYWRCQTCKGITR